MNNISSGNVKISQYKCHDSGKAAFTLAEALIVIGIIGVVAALTLPTFITKISGMVDKNNKTVIEKRLLEGFNQLNTMDSGFDAQQYEDTESFVWALSKYYKINTICSADDIGKCFPYGKMKYTTKVGITDLNVEDLKTPEDFSLSSEEWFPPASFIDGKGTSFAMLLKKDCIKDSSEAMRSLPTDCVQYMYDINGSRTPNKMGADIQVSEGMSFGIKLADGRLQDPIGEYTTYWIPDSIPAAINTCDRSPDLKWDTRGSSNGSCATNYWAAAKKACAMAGYELPDIDTLGQLLPCRAGGMSIYKGRASGNCDAGISKDTTLLAKLAEKSSTNKNHWSASLDPNDPLIAVPNTTFIDYARVTNGNIYTVCLGKDR